jgi:hypothetical protein
MLRGRFSFWLTGGLLLAGIAGCSDSTRPPDDTPADGAATVNGAIDPGQGSFVLTTIPVPVPDGIPVHVDLLGSSLEVDAANQQVSLLVAVRNADSRALYAPAEITIGSLTPAAVWVMNADWVRCPDSADSTIFPRPGGCWYGILYSDLLGDGVLEPGETTEPRRWTFSVTGLAAFSFSATARFGLDPDRPRIAGLYFWDHDWSGAWSEGDLPYGGGTIRIRTPDDQTIEVATQADGRYAVPVTASGLYMVTAVEPPIASPVPVRYTTPNPLQVLLTPGPDGRPRTFDHADFGMNLGWPPGYPPVLFFDGPADSLVQDRYDLVGLDLKDTVLHLRAGFSGCGPDHPLRLYVVGGFMESNPVQVKLLLSHDSLGELCDAYWVADVGFDLRPLQEAYREAYGRLDPIILRFRDWTGADHSLRLLP